MIYHSRSLFYNLKRGKEKVLDTLQNLFSGLIITTWQLIQKLDWRKPKLYMSLMEFSASKMNKRCKINGVPESNWSSPTNANLANETCLVWEFLSVLCTLIFRNSHSQNGALTLTIQRMQEKNTSGNMERFFPKRRRKFNEKRRRKWELNQQNKRDHSRLFKTFYSRIDRRPKSEISRRIYDVSEPAWRSSSFQLVLSVYVKKKENKKSIFFFYSSASTKQAKALSFKRGWEWWELWQMVEVLFEGAASNGCI